MRAEVLTIKPVKGSLQMGERHRPGGPYGESVELIELRLVRHVGCLVAKHLPWINHSHLSGARPCHFFELAHRDRGRVGPEHLSGLILDPKCVLHVARWVVFGNIQCGEVMPIVFELGAVRNTESHPAKYLRNVANRDRDRVKTPWLNHATNIAEYATVAPYMSAEAITYPFIFLAIFFESFILVTFLSKPAQQSRQKTIVSKTPSVAIIVSCWDEEKTIAGTIESLLALDYPAEKVSFILVDDGSTDGTPAVLDHFAKHPQIIVLHKEHAGKFAAMNYGIEYAGVAELIGFLDADSFVAPDALREIVSAFDAPDIMAVTASMSVHQPRTLIQRMQYAEYALAIAIRHIFASLNGLYVTPGPFSFYRRAVFTKLGLFTHAHLAEDMEMAMRIQRAGYRIGNAMRARVYTRGPATFQKLMRQRVRWTTGFLRNILFDYRDLIGSRKNRVLGLFVLPLALIAIGGGILIFFISVMQLVQNGWHAFSVVQTAPLSYAFSWHPFSWYDFPITAITFLSLTLLMTTFTWMLVGKTLSKTPGRLMPNLLSYLVLYWLIAPLWLIRSVADVAIGTRTTWR